MKKFYSLITLLVAMFAVTTAKAQVTSATQLFGTWTFSADIEYFDDSYKDFIHNESEVTIKKDLSGNYAAAIDGLFGVEGSYQQAKFSKEESSLVVTNPNGANWDGWGTLGYNLGIFVTDNDSNYPFDRDHGFYNAKYTTNGDGTEISIPDMYFVAVDFKDEVIKSTVAKATNVKLTLKEREVIIIPDISNNYSFEAVSTHDFGIIENWPVAFELEVTANDSTFKSYTVFFHYPELGNFGFGNATFDGDILSVPFSNSCVDLNNNVYLAALYDDSLDGTIEFNLVGENLSLSSGMSFAIPLFNEDNTEVIDSLIRVFWYGGGIAKVQKDKPSPTFTIDGKYNATATMASDDQEGKFPVSGPIEIQYYEGDGNYYITNFLGYDTYTFCYGGLMLLKDETDPMKASIDITPGLNYLGFIGETWESGYYVLLDNNMTNTPIPVTFSEDGTMTISSEFCIGTEIAGEVGFATLYSSLTAKKQIPSAQDWTGSHVINPVQYAYVAEGETIPTEGTLNVIYDNSYGEWYLITNLLTYDTGDINYGGIALVFDESNPHKATLDLSYSYLAFDNTTFVGTNIAGIDGNPVELTLNDDGTVTIGDFQITKGSWGEEPAVLAATVIPSSVISINATELEGKTYDLMGREVNGKQSGIVLRNVGGRFVKVFNK